VNPPKLAFILGKTRQKKRKVLLTEYQMSVIMARITKFIGNHRIMDDEIKQRTICISERDASKLTGLCARTLFNLRKTAGLPHIVVGSRILYPMNQLERYFADRVVVNEPEAATPEHTPK
jgi:hypothetical protein